MRSLSVVTRSGISSLTISEVLARLQPGQDTSEPGDEVGCKLRPATISAPAMTNAVATEITDEPWSGVASVGVVPSSSSWPSGSGSGLYPLMGWEVTRRSP